MFAIAFLLSALLIAAILALASLKRRRAIGLAFCLALLALAAPPAEAGEIFAVRTGFGDRAFIIDDGPRNNNVLLLPSRNVDFAFAPRGQVLLAPSGRVFIDNRPSVVIEQRGLGIFRPRRTFIFRD